MKRLTTSEIVDEQRRDFLITTEKSDRSTIVIRSNCIFNQFIFKKLSKDHIQNVSNKYIFLMNSCTPLIFNFSINQTILLLILHLIRKYSNGLTIVQSFYVIVVSTIFLLSSDQLKIILQM